MNYFPNAQSLATSITQRSYTKKQRQANHHKGLTITVIGVNKSADTFIIGDQEEIRKKSRGLVSLLVSGHAQIWQFIAAQLVRGTATALFNRSGVSRGNRSHGLGDRAPTERAARGAFQVSAYEGFGTNACQPIGQTSAGASPE